MGIRWANITAILVLLFAGVAHADNEMIVVMVNNKDCTLSTKVQKLLKEPPIQKAFVTTKQKLYVVDALKYKDYAKRLGTKYMPTMYRLKKVEGKWIKINTFNPTEQKYSIDSILKFLGVRKSTKRVQAVSS
jgi:hypothetical protein